MLLSVAAEVVAERSSRFWVLDNIEESQMRRDELQLHGAGVEAVFDHRPSHEEPLLWVVDVALWAYGQEGTGSGARLRSSTSTESSPESAKPSYSPSGELARFTFRSSWNGQHKYVGNLSVRKPIPGRKRRTRLPNQKGWQPGSTSSDADSRHEQPASRSAVRASDFA